MADESTTPGESLPMTDPQDVAPSPAVAPPDGPSPLLIDRPDLLVDLERGLDTIVEKAKPAPSERATAKPTAEHSK